MRMNLVDVVMRNCFLKTANGNRTHFPVGQFVCAQTGNEWQNRKLISQKYFGLCVVCQKRLKPKEKKNENSFSNFPAQLTMEMADHSIIGKLSSCTYGKRWVMLVSTRRNSTSEEGRIYIHCWIWIWNFSKRCFSVQASTRNIFHIAP